MKEANFTINSKIEANLYQISEVNDNIELLAAILCYQNEGNFNIENQ